MQITNQLIQGVSAKLLTAYNDPTSALYHIDYYYDHAPQETDPQNAVTYPLIVFSVIDAPYSYAMPSDVAINGTNYVKSRVQMSVYINDYDSQFASMMAISVALEDLFHRQSLTVSNSVSHIATLLVNSGIGFAEQGSKVYGYHSDYKFYLGE